MTDHPTFEEMTEAEQNELIVALYRGQPTELFLDGEWQDKFGLRFSTKLPYRLKPKPVIARQTVRLGTNTGRAVGYVTYTTVNGKAQEGTFTNDAGETVIVERP